MKPEPISTEFKLDFGIPIGSVVSEPSKAGRADRFCEWWPFGNRE